MAQISGNDRSTMVPDDVISSSKNERSDATMERRECIDRGIGPVSTIEKRLKRRGLLAFDQLFFLHQKQGNRPGVTHGSRSSASSSLIVPFRSFASSLFKRTTLPPASITSKTTLLLDFLASDTQKRLFTARRASSNSETR